MRLVNTAVGGDINIDYVDARAWPYAVWPQGVSYGNEQRGASSALLYSFHLLLEFHHESLALISYMLSFFTLARTFFMLVV